MPLGLPRSIPRQSKFQSPFLGWLWLGLLSPGLLFAQELPQDPLAPGRPHGIDGAGGFKTVSVVEFQGTQNQPHEWIAIYAYPDRARWSLRPTTGAPTSPMVVLRFGAHAWTLPAGSSKSSVDDLNGPRTTLIQMELRRALNIWPAGFDWEPEDERTSRAEVRRLENELDHPALGYLMARTDEAGQLQGIEAFRADGTSVEELRIQAWAEFEERLWPAQILLLKNGQEVWKETLSFASRRAYHNDVLFTPPDRRRSEDAEIAERRKMRHIDLPQVTLQLKKLKSGTPWARAERLYAKELAAARKQLDRQRLQGIQLEQVPTFQLDPDGRPTHHILRLEQPLLPAPKGWQTLETRPGLGLVIQGFEALDPALLKGLERALPAQAKAGVPYCRVLRIGDQAQLQVYQPVQSQ